MTTIFRVPPSCFRFAFRYHRLCIAFLTRNSTSMLFPRCASNMIVARYRAAFRVHDTAMLCAIPALLCVSLIYLACCVPIHSCKTPCASQLFTFSSAPTHFFQPCYSVLYASAFHHVQRSQRTPATNLVVSTLPPRIRPPSLALQRTQMLGRVIIRLLARRARLH